MFSQVYDNYHDLLSKRDTIWLERSYTVWTFTQLGMEKLKCPKPNRNSKLLNIYIYFLLRTRHSLPYVSIFPVVFAQQKSKINSPLKI